MKGIILAGGSGSRLWPITLGTSKQLIPIFDKPMIYYPLATLIMAGIREVLIICTPEHRNSFEKLFSNGNQLGMSIEYATQDSPDGLAQAFIIGETFISEDSVCLILGDNIFHGPGLGQGLQGRNQKEGALVFAYQVSNPEEYGVVEFNNEGVAISIEEKPAHPKSKYAIPGIYFYGPDVVQRAKLLVPSDRGELEITSLNNGYLNDSLLKVETLNRGVAWLDTGTVESMIQAAEYVRVVESRQGVKIGCIEEAAWRNGWIDDIQLETLAEPLIKSGYGEYLVDLVRNK